MPHLSAPARRVDRRNRKRACAVASIVRGGAACRAPTSFDVALSQSGAAAITRRSCHAASERASALRRHYERER